MYSFGGANYKKDTIKHHEGVIKTVFKFINPNIAVKDITRLTVNEFILDCRSNLRIKDITLNTYVRSLRKVLYYFMEMGYIERFNIKAPRFDKQIIPTYSDEDLKKLLKKPNMKKCDFIEYRNYMICQFFMGVGCRTRTLINIKIKDLDFDNNVVFLNTTKNRKPLIIPLATTLRKELRAKDVLIVYEMDRLGRNKQMIKEELEWFKGNNIRIIILDIPTTQVNLDKFEEGIAKSMLDMINKILIEVLSTIAEEERKKIKKRQAEGIEIAKAEGKYKGRKSVSKEDLPRDFGKLYKQWKDDKISAVQFSSLLGLKSRTTLYKYVKIYEGQEV